MLRPKMCKEIAANGHLMLSWPDAGEFFYTMLCWRLRIFHGLRRVGKVVYFPDDTIILPDLVGEGLRLKAGWDNWSGYHLLAEDQAGDRFLERLAAGNTASG
jgi:hypothetical protein